MSSPKSPPKPPPTLIVDSYPTARLYSGASEDQMENYKIDFMNKFRLKTLGEMKRILSFIRKLTKAVIKMTRTFDVYPPGTTLTWQTKDRFNNISSIAYTRATVKSAEKSLNEAITNIYYYFRKRGSKNTVKGESLRKFQGTYSQMYMLPGPAQTWIQTEYFGEDGASTPIPFWNYVTNASNVRTKEETLLWNGYCLSNTYNMILYISANANKLKTSKDVQQADGRTKKVPFIKPSTAMFNTFGSMPSPIYSASYFDENGTLVKYKGPPNAQQAGLSLLSVIAQDSVSTDKTNIVDGRFIDDRPRFAPVAPDYAFHMYWFLKINSLSGVNIKALETVGYPNINADNVIATLKGNGERLTAEHNAVKTYNATWNQRLTAEREEAKKQSSRSRITVV